MARIRKGDMVEVISGNDRGKKGRVLQVIPDRDRVVVQGIALRWKHMRKSQQTPQGGRVRREASVHVSNIMLFDEEAETRTRVGFSVEGGKKIRVGRKTGKEIGHAAAAAPKAKAKKTKKKASEKAKDEE